jgi:hypothetical protein
MKDTTRSSKPDSQGPKSKLAELMIIMRTLAGKPVETELGRNLRKSMSRIQLGKPVTEYTAMAIYGRLKTIAEERGEGKVPPQFPAKSEILAALDALRLGQDVHLADEAAQNGKIPDRWLHVTEVMDEITERLETLRKQLLRGHPYFAHLAAQRMRALIHQFSTDQAALLHGTHVTTPASPDKFGIPGISLTKPGGSLWGFSSLRGFWADSQNHSHELPSLGPYVQKQRDLVRHLGITVRRLFVLSKWELGEFAPILATHEQCGFDVRLVFQDCPKTLRTVGESASVWLNEDYLIQDARLVVMLETCPSLKGHLYERTNVRETITTDPAVVADKVARFQHLWDLALTTTRAFGNR